MPQSSKQFPHGAWRLRVDTEGAVEHPIVRIGDDGESIEGLLGEPIAVALMAPVVRVFLRMPKSGDPRGGFCFSGECSDCLVTVDGRRSTVNQGFGLA